VKRLCFGPTCRDLQPVRRLWCPTCRAQVRREKLAEYHQTWIAKPGKRAMRQNYNREYMRQRRAVA
jgi:hypothetical protein